ncbi:MAG: ribosome biogenesis GTP-binding protein YihA/YsxC [Cyclobacteriaceae bacterium]
MVIKEAKFIKSSPTLDICPPANRPEYAFIGRSNVGKSSLINMLTDRKSLAKTSGTPGKTQHINHFDIDGIWYLVDLPGYGWARVSKTIKEEWNVSLRNYLKERENLICTFVLIDIRHEPQKNDLTFIEWMGENQLPFTIVFTKADKLKPTVIDKYVKKYTAKLKETWEDIPPYLVTSSEKGMGKDEVLNYIDELNKEF